jgi:hypothetical protein
VHTHVHVMWSASQPGFAHPTYSNRVPLLTGQNNIARFFVSSTSCITVPIFNIIQQMHTIKRICWIILKRPTLLQRRHMMHSMPDTCIKTCTRDSILTLYIHVDLTSASVTFSPSFGHVTRLCPSPVCVFVNPNALTSVSSHNVPPSYNSVYASGHYAEHLGRRMVTTTPGTCVG